MNRNADIGLAGRNDNNNNPRVHSGVEKKESLNTPSLGKFSLNSITEVII